MTDLDPLRPHLKAALVSHVEHAKTWPSGWVRWTLPRPWRVEALVICGFLTAGTDGAVHITDAGRVFLDG